MEITLPAYIPQFLSRRRTDVLRIGERLVAVSLDRILLENGTVRYSGVNELLRVLALPAGTRVALIGTCRDLVLERFWTKADAEGSWQRIAEFGFTFVTSLTLSVYDDLPLFSQKFNQDRNFLSHDIFASYGVPCIPFLMPNATEDYGHIAEWLSARPDVGVVAVHGSGYTRSERLFAELVNRMRRIASTAPRDLQMLVVGIASPKQIQEVLREFDACIVNPRAVAEAIIAGNKFDRGLKALACPGVPKNKLILPNIRSFEDFCKTAAAVRYLPPGTSMELQ